MTSTNSVDQKTADAFADSWNHLPQGSVYTMEQAVDWFAPLTGEDFKDKKIIELGCGNASLLYHVMSWNPAQAVGVDLGSSVDSALKNLSMQANKQWNVVRSDLTTYRAEEKADITYCIGVLHHLKEPEKGFVSLVENTKVGGKFHAWVYAYEGNWVIRNIVDPIRRVASRLPWWFTKYVLATSLVIPFFIYAKIMNILPRWSLLKKLPLYEYSLWIAKRGFLFFRHVAFDQLVTPQTAYIKKSDIEGWLAKRDDVEQTYIIMRNGNSWKFGGLKK
jgi:SAM-dependent methyltransferase